MILKKVHFVAASCKAKEIVLARTPTFLLDIDAGNPCPFRLVATYIFVVSCRFERMRGKLKKRQIVSLQSF